ncbi:MAG: ATP-binding protein [Syntrophobacteraceae bacterium]
MIDRIEVRGFKSIENVAFEPGVVNVLIGANGSGKSNLLEAIGVLSAAVSGRVDDEALLRRGVRPGVPALYKCSFRDIRAPLHIHFGAWFSSASCEVSLFNPIEDPSPAWRYHTENLKEGGFSLVGRSHRTHPKLKPEAGLVALEIVEMADHDDAFQLVDKLRDFAIYTPDTDVLRGIVPDRQPRQPIGLSGGQLANALSEVLSKMTKIPKTSDADWEEQNKFFKNVYDRTLRLVDWAKAFGPSFAPNIPLSPSVGSTEKVISFKDRFMKPGRDILSAYDASEGALYVLFHAVLAGHSNSPPILAVDNADHGLNPRLARSLLEAICDWYLDSPYSHQIFLTTHNPLSLDGLPLQNDQVRLFTVSRTEKGRTVVNRLVLDKRLKDMAEKGWSLSRLWVMGHLGGVANV